MGRACRCLDVIERVLSGNYHPVYRRLVSDANQLNGRWMAYEREKTKISGRESKILKLAYRSVMARLDGAGLELSSQPNAQEPWEGKH